MYYLLAIRIGFSVSEYEVNESSAFIGVELIKENNIKSEQTFSLDISVQFSPIYSILPAIQVTNENINGGDFILPNQSTSLNLKFLPSTQVMLVEVIILDDVIAEGREAFLLHCSKAKQSPHYHVPTYGFSDTRIIIEDNDSKL